MFTFIIDYFNNMIRYNQTIRELSNLNDKELKDLGICRYSIPYIAAESIVNSNK